MELDNRMISAERLKTRCYEICDEYNTNHVYIDRIIDEIDNAPDAEVIRCKDCSRGDQYASRPPYIYCMEYGRLVEKDDYCSYGERKDNGTA